MFFSRLFLSFYNDVMVFLNSVISCLTELSFVFSLSNSPFSLLILASS